MFAAKPTFYIRPAASLVTMLVLAAFVLSALIPAGFMPEFSKEGGSYELVICSGMGTKTITVQSEPVDGHKAGSKFSVCDYKSFASTQSVEPTPPVYLPAPVIELGQASFPPEQVLSQILFAGLSARGPPAV